MSYMPNMYQKNRDDSEEEEEEREEKKSGSGNSGRKGSSGGFKFKTSDFVKHRHHTGSSGFSSVASDADDVPLFDNEGGGPGGEGGGGGGDQDFFDSKYETLQFLGGGRNGSKVFACRPRGEGGGDEDDGRNDNTNNNIKAVKIWRKSRKGERSSNRKQRRQSSILPSKNGAPFSLVDFEDIDLSASNKSNASNNNEANNNNHNNNNQKKNIPDELYEFYLMQEMDGNDNPNIVSIYELLEGPNHYYMVMEYMGGGTIEDHVSHQPGERYAEDKVGHILLVLLRTLAFMHHDSSTADDGDRDIDNSNHNNYNTSAVVHCDLNLSNILLDDTQEKVGMLKLIDFDNAVVLPQAGSEAEEDGDDGIDWYKPRGAQLPFMAPEMLAYDQKFCKASDMWSLGVIAYILLSGKYPFGYKDMTSTLELQQIICEILGVDDGDLSEINEEEEDEDDEDGNDGSEEGNNTADPYQRNSSSSATSLLFNERHNSSLAWNDCSDLAKDFIVGLLQYNPDHRPTAQEALQHAWMEQIRQKILDNKLAGGGSYHHRNTVQHGQQVWQGLKETARKRGQQQAYNKANKANPQPHMILKQAALTLIASQLVLKDEKKYIDEIFQMMDIKADGVLSKDEVRRGYAEIFQKPIKESDLEVLFDKVDWGGTGTIDYCEFVIAAMNEKELLHTDKLRKAFDIFDTDNTGFIEAANLKPLLKSYLQEHDESEHVEILESIITHVDRDGDGKICLDEFIAMMLHSNNGNRSRRQRAGGGGAAGMASLTASSKIRSGGGMMNPALKSSLSTSVLMGGPSDVFASTISANSASVRRSVWESTVQLTFRPEHIIGKRSAAEQLKDYYDIGEYIQSGTFGSVWFCTHKESGSTRAVKYVKKGLPKENELILREFNILKSLDHPNILKMYEVFEDPVHYEIVMDACLGGDLCDEIDNYGAIDEVGACLILHQVLGCVNYCHQRHIVHCDLKPDNILMEGNKAINQIKIIDFGLAINLVGEAEKKEGSVKNGRICEKRGTLRFMAPEVLRSNFGPKCDVWACGVICFLLLTDRFPFNGKDRIEIIDKIQCGAYEFSDPVWSNLSQKVKNFIQSCLTVEEDARPTAEEALQHPWIRAARNAVDKNFHHNDVCKAAEALDNLKNFQARSVLAQAAHTFIASQLLLKEEKAKIDEVFRVIDLSCDGKLSKQELKTGYKTVFGCELSDEEVDQIFERVDIDGSGYIEYSEFVIASLGQKGVLKNDNLKKAFQQFATKNRDYISKSNLKRGLSSFLGKKNAVDDKMISRIMKEVDRDGDGVISYEEFLATMLNLAEVPKRNRKAEGLFSDVSVRGLGKGFLNLFDKKKSSSKIVS